MTTQSDTYLQSALEQLGLTNHEARVYRACLSRGEATIMDIAKLTSVGRTTIYGVAEGLVHKGMLRFVQKGAHRVYSAEDPKKFQHIIDKNRDVLDRKAAFLSSILPTLSMRFSEASNKPLVTYYEGQKEIHLIFEDFLASGTKEAVFIGEATTIEQALGSKYLKSMVSRRIKLGIKARGVRKAESELEDPLYAHGAKNLRNIRFAPSFFKAPVYTGVYLNKVFFVSSVVESYGILVESKDLSDMFRDWFEVLWNASSPAIGKK